MCDIWANQLLPKALKTCPKSNKSPSLVTLGGQQNFRLFVSYFQSGFYQKNVVDDRFLTNQMDTTTSVTRFGEILPVWRNFKSIGQIFRGFIQYFAKCSSCCGKHVLQLDKFSLLQMSKQFKIISHLVTLMTTSTFSTWQQNIKHLQLPVDCIQ